MPLIGDELRTILGMMPVRDRAGIARGTMADDAVKASAAAESGNAEGAALMQQGRPMPPPMGGPSDIQLPDNVPTAFASGRGGGAPPPMPVPQERVVAASPAAAPSEAVATRASDVAIAALEQRARQQKMMQLVGSLGLIANAFNRNPASQAATKASLADMVGGGGGGGGGGNQLADIKTISEMRDKEDQKIAYAAARAKTVPELQRMFGWSKDRAEAAFDSDEYKKWLDPTAIQKREEDSRAARVRMDLSDPKVIAEISKRTGSPEAVVKADIASGKIGQKELADILHTQAQTGKLGVDTAKTTQEIEEARKSNTAFAFYKDNPEAFARLHSIPVEEAQRIVSDRKNYDKYQETSGPTAYADEAGYAQAKREGYKGSRADWKSIRPGAETIDEYTRKKEIDAGIATDRQRGEKYFEENKDARDAYTNLQTIRKMQQDLHDDDMISGPLSLAELKGRQIFAKLTGRPDADVSTTNAFNAYRNQVVVQISKDLKGATTEGDRELLEKAAGGSEMTAPELRRFIILQDIADQRRIESKKQQAEGFRESDPKRHKQMLEGVPDYPPPNKKIREDMAAKPGLVKMVQENPNEEVDFPRLDGTGRPMMGKNGKPKVETMTVKEYAEKTWGPGGYEYIRKQAKKD